MTAVLDDGIFINTVKPSLWECPVWHRATEFTEEFNQELLKELYEIAAAFDPASDAKSLLDYDRPCLRRLIEYKTQVITDVVNQYLPAGQEARVQAA